MRIRTNVIAMFTVAAFLLAAPSVSNAVLTWNFNGALPAGWTQLTGHPASFQGNGVEAARLANGTRAHDSAHPSMLLESPGFYFSGSDDLAGATSYRLITEGGNGNQNNLADPANPGALPAASSSTGQMGAALLNMTTGNYDAVLYDPGNGGGVQTVSQNLGGLGINLADEYKVHVFENDDGGWGWTRFNSIEVADGPAPQGAGVPEPTGLLILGAVSLIGFAGRRRRQA